jgi:hypothetical protein
MLRCLVSDNSHVRQQSECFFLGSLSAFCCFLYLVHRFFAVPLSYPFTSRFGIGRRILLRETLASVVVVAESLRFFKRRKLRRL